MSASRAPLPLPIATLVRRARNATDPTRKHLAAFYAWEASVRLAVASEPPEDKSALVVPSTGHWVRAMPERKGTLTDPALVALHVLLSEVGLEQRSTPKSTTAQKLLGMLPPYRNKVIGHGSTRPDSFNQEAARIFLAAIEPAWSSGMFLPENAVLFYMERVEIDADGSRKASLVRLEGLASEREGELDDIGAEVLPGRMYVRRDGQFFPLYPWLLFESNEDRERALFFNSYKATTEYLDYASGELLKAKAFAATYPTLDADVSALFGGAPAKRPVPSVRPPVAAQAVEEENEKEKEKKEAEKPEEQVSELSRPSKPLDPQAQLKKNLLVPLIAGVLAAGALLGGRVWLDTQKLNPVAVEPPVLSMSSAPVDKKDGLEIPRVSDDPAVQSEFRRGVEALLSADIFGAETSFLSVKEKAPKAAWPYLGLAMTAGLQRHFEDSNRALDDAAANMRGQTGRDAELVAIVDNADNDAKKGLELWSELRAKHPRFLLAYLVVAYYYWPKGTAQEGIERLWDARKLDDTHALSYFLESMIQTDAGKLPEALAAIEKALALQAASPWLVAQRGLLRLRMGDLEAAREDLEAAIARRGPFSAHRAYALSLLTTGKPADDAAFARERATLLETKNVDDRLDFMCVHPLVLLYTGRASEADGLVREAVDFAIAKGKQGTLLRCLVMPAHADALLGRFDEAEAKFIKMGRVWEGFGLAKTDELRGKIIFKGLKGAIAVEKGDIAAAEAELADLKKTGASGFDELGYLIAIAKKEPVTIPDAPGATGTFVRFRRLHLQARALLSQGKLEDAERAFSKIADDSAKCSSLVFDANLLCGPYLADSLFRVATLREKLGKKEEALQALDQLRAFWPRADADLRVMKQAAELRKKLERSK